jgi:hypothetical protein
MIIKVGVVSGDTCGNYDYKHYGYYDVDDINDAKKIFIDAFFQKWDIKELNMKPLPKHIISASEV